MVTKRGKRWIARGVSAIVLVLIVAFLAVTWLQAGTVHRDWLAVSHDSTNSPSAVVGVRDGEIVLERAPGIDASGTWGLEFVGGRAVVGDVLDSDEATVTRALVALTGAATPGTEVRMDRAVWDLGEADGLGFEEQLVEGEEGPLAVWTIPADEDTWVVFLHGNGAEPDEGFRLARAVADAGFPVLVTSYGSDSIDPSPSESAVFGYGYDEWKDIHAALDLALAQGARDFVLVGYGGGASIAGAVLYESYWAERVVGVVADAPMFDLASAIHDAWAERGAPGWVIGWTKAVASMRFGLDLGAIDHVDRVEQWHPPTLILHGRSDPIYPLDVSEAFAIAKAEDALLITFPDAGAGESWNSDPDRYEAVVLGFLDDVGSGPSRFFEPES